jgi:hypothetical protein
MSGARLDLGEPERALQELDIPELDPDRAFEWSPGLFAARATVLEELGRTEEAARWQERAEVAAEAIDAAHGAGDLETVFIDEIIEIDDEDDEDHEDTAADTGEDVVDDAVVDDGVVDDAAGEEASAPPSIEDEVAEILVEAGVEEAPEAGTEGAER